MTQHRLILMPSGRHGDVDESLTLLEAARSLGVEIESICGGRQTCGKCLVQVEQGKFDKHQITSTADHLTPPNEAEIAYAVKQHLNLNDCRLSCAAHLTGDLLVTVPEASLARKQVIRKGASDLLIEVAPSVRLAYVEVPKATLGGRGDWQRLQMALVEQAGFTDQLTIDPLLLRSLQAALRAEKGAVTVTIWAGREVIRIEPGYVESLYGLAVDVGSTTVAAHLCDLRTGAVLATEAMMNPQVRYGEDLMSRVSYGMNEANGVQRMHHSILRVLDQLAERVAETAGIQPSEITDVVLVGNTVMHHLLLGIDPVHIGAAPFALSTEEAVDLRAREFGLKTVHHGAMIHLLPCIAGYVGADNVGVLLAEQPQLTRQTTLILDIGTNAEIILAHDGRLYSASSPTGPAFEGAQISHGQRAAAGAIERFRYDPASRKGRYKVIGDSRWSDQMPPGEALAATGICGSGIIEIVAELFSAGLILPSGRFDPQIAEAHPQIRPRENGAEFIIATADETATGREIVLTQTDVRAIQLAKGALYSGARLLMDVAGAERVEVVKLAGAFGSYIDPRCAMIIGMIPDCALQNVHAVGNAAGDGARIALLNREQRQLARTLARQVQYVETAADPRFQDYFVEALTLPHASDTFPLLEATLALEA